MSEAICGNSLSAEMLIPDVASLIRATIPSQMREIMRERGDLLLAQRLRHISHCRLRTTGTHTGFVIMQRLDQIFLALTGEPRHGLGADICIRVA